jgi:hypothetical protein
MPRHLSRINILVLLALILMLLTTAGYLLVPRLLDLETYRAQILAELRQSLHRPVSYGSGTFTVSYGPAISFSNVVIKEPQGAADFITVERLTCRIALLPLLKKQVIIKGLQADKPVVHIMRQRDGRFNFSDLLERKEAAPPPLSIKQIGVRGGTVYFRDFQVAPAGLASTVEGIDLHLGNLARGAKCELKLAGKMTAGGSGSFSLSGKVRLAPKESPLADTELDLKIALKQMDAAHFWPYYSSHVPFRKVLGRVDTETVFAGKLRQFTSHGKVSVNGLRFDYQPVFRTALTPASLQMKYSMELTGKDVVVKGVEVSVDGVEIKGSCAVRDFASRDPRITAQGVTSNFDFEKCRQYIPYGIIVKDTADWIEQHITGGIFRLDDGRLDGRVSQILHMEQGDNYNVLYVKGRVEKGVVSYGKTVPTFNTIKGILEMKGKDFFLHQMSGAFGTAPFTLEGRITDYPLVTPCAYPFRMTISPGQGELAWLLGETRSKRLSYNGNASLNLSGDGYTSGYALSGTWNLSPAAYAYNNLVTKPVGTPSSLAFRVALSPRETKVTSLQYTLGPLALNLTATYPHASSTRLDLAVTTNLFNIGEIAGMLPGITKYQPSGRVQVAAQGKNAQAGSDDFIWRGYLSMMNASFKPLEEFNPVSSLNGTVSFAESTMESSHLTGRIGGTIFSGKGSISSFKPLTVSTTFTAPRIDLADVGLTQKEPVQITRVQADLSIKDDTLQIRSLSGQLNSSPLLVKGTVTDFDSPKADLVVSSSSLDIADLILLGGIDLKRRQGDKPSSPLMVKASVKADSGIFRDIRYERLNSSVEITNRVIHLNPLEAVVCGGKLTARGDIDTQPTPIRHTVEFKLAKAAASQVMQLFSVDKREVTGTMTAEGELTARGEAVAELKRTVAGPVKVFVHKGTLRQFSALSKVFSILNVSQLFKLRLPDMVSEGMPFNDIKANLSFKEGTVSTNDLFVSSNAMNMSLIGKYDFVRDNLDLTLGIQPLQTVDKVVSHIPIVGWILTGKDKALITTYFEIKGKSENPQVSAIPVKYLGRGVLDIFKRVFQLPAKLVTDTGEVILGN